MSRNLTPEAAREMAGKREKFGAGPGRPLKKAKRCRCGKFTARTAKRRYHVC